MIPYLEGFIKRMEMTACIASIIKRKNTNREIEKQFDECELDNIIFSVLIHIMERTLTEENDCTIEDIERFISGILPLYGKYLTDIELHELSRYIIKDILQNKGEAFSYYIMDYSDGRMKEQKVRLIADKINDDNEIVYFLDKQGYNMLLRTKEIDDLLGFQIEEIRLRLLIGKKNYSAASKQSTMLLHMLNEKQNEIYLFEKKLIRDINSVTGEEYDDKQISINSMLYDEYEIMKDIEKTINLAQNSLDEEMKLGKNSDEFIEARKNIVIISRNINTILIKQRMLLADFSKLRGVYSNAIKSAITARRIRCYNIEDVILNGLENYENNNLNDIEKVCAMLLAPLTLPKFPDNLNISLFYTPQSCREISENTVYEEEETIDVSDKQLAIEKRNAAHVKTINLLLEYSSLHREFTFSDFWNDCIAVRKISYFTQDKLIFIVMLRLFEIGCINIEEWKNDDNIPVECDGEFDLSYALGKIASENSNLFDIKKLYIKKGQNLDKQLQGEILLNSQELSKSEAELDTCEKEIENIKNILREYDIDEKYVFEKESNLNLLNEKATEIAEKYDKQLRKLHRKKDLLDKLNKKQLHISREFAELLEKNGIDYQTGEDYLSAQPTEYLDDLLTNNDMLPYCFIVNDTDFEKTLAIDHETTIDRICPVVKRSSIGRKTEMPNIHFYDLYNKESIDKRTSADYSKRLEAEIESMDQSIAALETALKKCNLDRDSINRFFYTSGMYSQLKINVENAKKSLEDTLCQKTENEKEMQRLSEKLILTDEKIETAKANIAFANEKYRKFAEYLTLAQTDLAQRAELKELSEKFEQAAFHINEMTEELSKFSKLKLDENTAISNCNNGRINSDEKANKFASYENGEFLDNKTEQLEAEYESLSKNFSNKKEYQENICCEADKDIKKLSKKLTDDFSDLSKEDYDITYEETEATRLKAECNDNQEAYRTYSSKITQAEDSLKIISKRLAAYMADLKREGSENPLSDSEIKGNYENRLDECRRNLNEAESDEKKFKDDCRRYEQRITILDKLIPDDIEFSDSVPVVSENIDIFIHKAEFKEIKNDLSAKKHDLKKLSDEIKKIYDAENDTIVNTIIDRIDSIDYDSLKNCYYSYERLDEDAIHINNEIILFKSKLENIENDKNHIIRHTYEHGRKLYNEVLSIFKNSYEKLQDGKGRHKIMEIDIADSLDNQAERRIADYVNTELAKLCDESENEHEVPTKLMNKLNRIFSDRNIFNAIANKSTYHIKVYKVNEIAANSHLELWESVYSGGERFVTCFMIFAALISYSRKSISGESSNDSRSVFLSDNPFGATSSSHLLDVLLKITKKYKLQLICFTALNQSSITNEFDLIYQLALHQAAYSNNSYLKIDDVKKKEGLRTDSDLEFISLKYHSDQLSLF